MQQKITSAAQLKEQIKELELRTKRQEAGLKEGVKATGQSIKQSLKPGNINKSGIQSVRSTPNMKTVALNTFIGLAAGFVTKKLIIGKSRNIIKRTLGAAIQAGITKMVHNKLPVWKNTAAAVISKNTNHK
jgi:hypothetical protein